ncbi:hypothetical protein GGX14DRAFT_620619 [Mycena pura]|uniref:Uncharacterized protein n=1 Tax=Mycena pura TaxID=153505 RepID=A0AAD6VKQ0_9AGAR|nr:hypothetical protein GGX14DRAFT_620619 [Mycena pura]
MTASLLSQQNTVIQASKAYAKEHSIVRHPFLSKRNALFVGFVIPHEECHRWAEAMFPDGPSLADHAFDTLFTSYLNYEFGEVINDSEIKPFHVVANPTGPPDVMYVIDIGIGEWENPLAEFNIDEVFDVKVMMAVEKDAEEVTRIFLKDKMPRTLCLSPLLKSPRTFALMREFASRVACAAGSEMQNVRGHAAEGSASSLKTARRVDTQTFSFSALYSAPRAPSSPPPRCSINSLMLAFLLQGILNAMHIRLRPLAALNRNANDV